jgi:hypothetical protein
MLHIMNAPGYPSPSHPVHELLNCMRLLSRIIPYVFEAPDADELEERIFWKSVRENPATHSCMLIDR